MKDVKIEANMTIESLIKEAHLLHNRASSCVNQTLSHNIAIGSFDDCLNIIYKIYKIYSNNNWYQSQKDSKDSKDSKKSNKSNKTKTKSKSINGNLDSLMVAISLHMNCLLNLAGLYSMNDDENNLSKAIELYKDAQYLYETDPSGFNKSSVNLKAWMLRGLADVYIKKNEISNALNVLNDALIIATISKDNQTEYYILCSQARALFEGKKLDKAREKFVQAITKGTILHNSNSMPYTGIDRDLYRNAALCYVSIANTHCKKFKKNNVSYVKNTQLSMKYYTKATKMYYQALKITQTIFGSQHIEYFKSLFEYGECQAQRGQFEQAYKIMEKVEKLILQNFDQSTKHEQSKFIQNVNKMIDSLKPLISNTKTNSNNDKTN